MRRRRWPAAIAVIAMCWAPEAAGQTAPQLLAQARAALDNDKDADALALLNKYLALRPDDVVGLLARVQARVALGDSAGGVADANRAVFLDATNASAYFHRARARRLGGDVVSALADYSTALAIEPRMVGAYNNRALCREALKDYAGAIDDYEKALGINPGYALGRKNLDALRLRMGVAAPPDLPPPDDAPLPLPPPPPLPAAESAPVRVGDAVPGPRLRQKVDPDYPAAARAARVQGAVVIDVVIGPDGRVRDATVIRSIPLLDDAALAAVRRWEYESPLVNGQPASVVMTVTVTFALGPLEG